MYQEGCWRQKFDAGWQKDFMYEPLAWESCCSRIKAHIV